MRLAKQATTGFSIMELLVVMAIAAVVAAITLPVTQVLIEQNNVMLCSSNLQRLGVAMKAYYLDWQGVPPVLLPATPPLSDPLTVATDPNVAPEGFPAVAGGYLEPNPLMVLYRAGYLRNRRSLHCPRDDMHTDASQPEYHMSYVGRRDDLLFDAVKRTYVNDRFGGDAWNGAEMMINRYKYNPARIPVNLQAAPPWNGGQPPSSYQQRRMLSPGVRADLFSVDVDRTGIAVDRFYWISHTDPQWWPDDTTVVTWCDAHADTYQRGGSGIYQVLYWDGSVVAQRRELFEIGGEPDPPAAWEVYPGD